MPIYVYLCECGSRFERLLPRDSAAPACPDCGGATRKVPAASSVGGRAAGRGAGAAGRGGGAAGRPAQSGALPPQWRGLRDGGPERVQREVEFRQRLADKHARTTATGGSAPSAGGEGGAGRPGASGD